MGALKAPGKATATDSTAGSGVERQAAEGAACDYRVTQEGLDAMLPHLEKQVVRAAPREIEAILCRQQGQPRY